MKTLKAWELPRRAIMGTTTCHQVIRPFSFYLLLAIFAVMTGLAQTQPNVQSRVVQPIDEASLVTLKDNMPQAAQPQFDRGPAGFRSRLAVADVAVTSGKVAVPTSQLNLV